jgi:hypothetical protein
MGWCLMPRVPQYDNPTVRQAALPGVRQNISTTAADFGGLQADSLRQTAQTLGRAGSEGLDLAVKRQEQANEAAVWQAYINLSNEQRGYLYGENGVMTKQGYDALGTTSKSAKDIGSMAERISGTLQNDRQKELFQKMYQRNLDSTLDGLSRHEAAQRRTYYDQVASGVVKSAQQDAATRWNDPAYIDQTAQIAVTALSGNMSSKGAAPELIEAETKAMRSGVWKSALEQAIAQNPIQAKEMLDKNRDKLTGEHAADLDNTIKKPLIAARASAISAQILTPAGSLPNNVAQRIAQQASAQGVDVAMAITIAKLENAKGDPNAKNPNSSARGIYQFIDSTWAAEGGAPEKRGDLDEQVRIGVQHIKKNQDALRSALGRDPTPGEVYLAHQQGIGGATALLSATGPQTALGVLTKVYKGDAGKAAAAIVNNGGRADMSAQEFVGLWDKKYARRSSGSAVDLPLADQIAAARALAGDDPDLQAAAVSAVTEQRRLAKQMKQDQEDEALERIYAHRLATGSYVGANPKDLAMLDNKSLLDLEKKKREMSDAGALIDIYGMSNEELAAVDPKKYINTLSETDFKSLLTMKKKARAGDVNGDLTAVRSVNAIAVDAMAKIGLHVSGVKSWGEDARKKRDAFMSNYQAQITELERREGRKAQPQEMEGIADKLSQKIVFDPDGLFNSVSKRRFEFKIDDVPANMKAIILNEAQTPTGLDKISAILGRRVTSVTDQVMIELYTAREVAKWGGKIEQ